MPFLTLNFPAFDPILVSIGPFAIRWYALAYIVGILLGWLYARALIRTERLWGGPAPMTLLDFDDFVLWVTLGIILGGRTGYVLFYNPAHFAAHPAEIVQLWKGGMSFHGGFTGCVVAVVLFARRRGISILSLGDITCAVGTIGLFLGRIANFINGELWGRPTTLPWGIIFPNAGPEPRHPSQLYEATLEGLVLFIILRIATHRLKWLQRRGAITGLFLVCYALARISLENVREPDRFMPHFPLGLTMGMMLSIPMALFGLFLVWRGLKQEPEALAGADEPA
jgi:phosphatidylglycerol:prolipoprotein diacylglycerol transferase